jgi:tRNA pseudouridine38-40 synthase
MRIALGIEYDGSQFHGWQKQPNCRTVQNVLEAVLSRIANQPVHVVCAGRTDTGVSAVGQVVHFDTSAKRNIRAWVYGSNSDLPQDVCVRWAQPVPDDFSARYSAMTRSYRYLIYNNPIRPSLLCRQVTWQYRPLDVEKMAQAAKVLEGEHDFSSFRAIECQAKSPVRNIKSLTVTRRDDLVIIDITANAFLHHMVRNIAGVLMTIGHGKRPVDWIDHVLAAQDRTQGAETAPAYGLQLQHVTYPDEFKLPNTSSSAFFWQLQAGHVLSDNTPN